MLLKVTWIFEMKIKQKWRTSSTFIPLNDYYDTYLEKISKKIERRNNKKIFEWLVGKVGPTMKMVSTWEKFHSIVWRYSILNFWKYEIETIKRRKKDLYEISKKL